MGSNVKQTRSDIFAAYSVMVLTTLAIIKARSSQVLPLLCVFYSLAGLLPLVLDNKLARKDNFSSASLTKVAASLLWVFVQIMAPQRKNRKPPLEVQCYADGAWYDGDIFLERSRLRIHFSGFGIQHDEFWDGAYLKDTNKFMEIVRLRSKQLQDFECTKVDVGTSVCANFKTLDGLESKYYDAKVISIHQSPHVSLKGARELCKCRFKLAWEAGPFQNEEVFVGCADISLIDPESVEKHPVARQVLQTARDHVEESVFRDGSEESRASEDAEVNGADILSEDLFAKDDDDDSFPVLDTEGLPDDIVQVLKDHAIVFEFLGKEADNLEAAIMVYNKDL